MIQETLGIGPFVSHTSGGGAHQVEEIAQRYLVTLDSQTRPRPEVAAELPSLEQGTWTIRPDGSMETIFKLRPNVKWHDGSPMLADDWVFGWEIDRDPELPNANTVPMSYITAAGARDNTTLVLQWSQTYPFANALTRRQMSPLQRSRHESIYRSDRDRFINSTVWNTELIGLGPYRVAEWALGSQIRFDAFDAFYLGRPKIDSIVVRFLHDANTLLANVLSDAIDVYLPLGLAEEAIIELKRSWATSGSGNQVLTYPDGRLRYVEVQWRADEQRPKALADQRTREAIYRAIDRKQLAEVMIPSGGKEADSWLLPGDPARETTFRGVIPNYRLDQAAAQRLLENVGYRRNPSGSLAEATSGDRFETVAWNSSGGGNERENAIVADQLRSLGMAVEQYIIPSSRMDDNEHRASFPGLNLTSRTVTADFENAVFRYRPPSRTQPLGTRGMATPIRPTSSWWTASR